MASKIVEAVQERYGAIARGEQSGCGCGCGSTAGVAVAIGYSEQEAQATGNLGLGCGNPLAHVPIAPGMTVLDLGAGAGFDAFLAWRQVGPAGRVIGVDMTADMLALARENARRLGATNVEFREGYIEQLPVDDNSVDLVISNCVINLSADKAAVFREIARVLKPGGRFAVSDIVLLAELPHEVQQDVAAYTGCIAGASLLNQYIGFAARAGLSELAIPQITPGEQLAKAYGPWAEKFAPEVLAAASNAVVSVKMTGLKR